MPKGLNIKAFGRRKSAGNILDNEASGDAPAQPSFRVIDRPEKRSGHGFEHEVKRGFTSPLQALRGKSTDNLALSQNRGSAGTTRSGSSGYYASSSATSAKHSSTSTLPTSLEQEREPKDEELFPAVRKTASQPMHQNDAPEINDLPPPPSFSSRAARAFSFGSKGKTPVKEAARDATTNKQPVQDVPPLPPQHGRSLPSPPRAHSPQRERALTTSSYASTTVPAPIRSELTLDASGFGTEDFGSMFDNMKRNSTIPIPSPPPAAGFHRTDSEPLYPPRTHSRQAMTPSPKMLLKRNAIDSPYGPDHQDSSAVTSPGVPDSSEVSYFLKGSKMDQEFVPDRQPSPSVAAEESLFAQSSSIFAKTAGKANAVPNRQTQLDDEDRWVKRIELQDPQGPSSTSPTVNRAIPAVPGVRTRDGPMTSSTPTRPFTSPKSATARGDIDSTPKATKRNTRDLMEEPLFDSSPVGPSSRAIRPSILEQAENNTTMRRMTKEQFETLQRGGNRSREQSEEENELSASEADDDEDDIDRARKMATQRRKQEANMSIYRQQMKKVTGGGPTDLPSGQNARPEINRGSSAPAVSGGFHLGGMAGVPPAFARKGKRLDSDEDDDVPLGILQAHGFPSNTRPPTRKNENDLNQQHRASMAGSVVGGQNSLPAFARRLPADPYFGAGIVNQTNRESLAMSSGASAYGGMSGTPPPMQQAMGHPGGLVGVIAGEERARAARRGSPNPQSGLGSNSMGMPLPQNMNSAARTMSMSNHPTPQIQYNGMPQMPVMGQLPMMDANQQQMQQFMQMQMQMMQNMIQMQQASMGGGQAMPQMPMMMPQQPPVADYMNPAVATQSPVAMANLSSAFQNNLAPNGNRSMTMSGPPTTWANNNQRSRPNSAVLGNSLAPAVSNLNLADGGPGPGYTPSIAPSERSNVGMPGRYRPVSNAYPSANAAGTISHNTSAGRSHSMTSSLTLQAFATQQASPDLSGTPFNPRANTGPNGQAASTIRVVDKPKGGPKVAPKPAAREEEEDNGWTEMRQKREGRKKTRFVSPVPPTAAGAGAAGAEASQHSRTMSAAATARAERAELEDLYKGLD